MMWLPESDKFEDMCNCFDRILACDIRTDRRTSCDGIVRPMHTRRAVKTNQHKMLPRHWDRESGPNVVIQYIVTSPQIQDGERPPSRLFEICS